MDTPTDDVIWPLVNLNTFAELIGAIAAGMLVWKWVSDQDRPIRRSFWTRPLLARAPPPALPSDPSRQWLYPHGTVAAVVALLAIGLFATLGWKWAVTLDWSTILSLLAIFIALAAFIQRMTTPYRAWFAALVAALMVWFNPAILLVGHAWPQWDSWIVAIYLVAVLCITWDFGFAAGLVIGIGCMVKGQILLTAPLLALWPLAAARFRTALATVAGFVLGASAIVSIWLIPTTPAALWLALAAATTATVAVVAAFIPFHPNLADISGRIGRLFRRAPEPQPQISRLTDVDRPIGDRAFEPPPEAFPLDIPLSPPGPRSKDVYRDDPDQPSARTPALSAVEGPALSPAEGPALSPPEGPALSPVEGPGRFTRPSQAGWVRLSVSAILAIICLWTLWRTPLPIRSSLTLAVPIKLMIVFALAGLPWLLTRRWISIWLAASLAGLLWIGCFRFGGSTSWFDVGFEYGTRHYPLMTMGPVFNLPAILHGEYNMRLEEPLGSLDLPFLNTSIPIRLRPLLLGIYALGLVACAIGAAMHERRRDPRALVALAAPWLLMFAVMPQMHDRSLLYAGAISAIGIAAGAGDALLCLLLSVTAAAGILLNLMVNTAATATWLQWLRPLDPGLGWMIILAAAIMLYLAVAPRAVELDD
jgi:hypothetical protein